MPAVNCSTTVHDCPRHTSRGRAGHTDITVSRNLAGVVRITTSDRAYDIPLALWLTLVRPSVTREELYPPDPTEGAPSS